MMHLAGFSASLAQRRCYITGMRLYSTLRPALFLLPPERAHRAAICALNRGLVPPSRFTHPSLHTRMGALELPSPVGLAAGFDKNAECYAAALRTGFGFVEIGTVTPRAQAGNPQPRLFRLTAEEAIINRLGFNNQGVEAAVGRLSARGAGVVGGNIGKNKETEDALSDYIAAMRVIYPQVDYITANISSPNTPGLRSLQSGDALRALVRGLHAEREACHSRAGGNLARGASAPEKVYFLGLDSRLRGNDSVARVGQVHPNNTKQAKPVFIKIAPDNDAVALEAIAEVALSEQVDGLIISNTTIARDGVATSPYAAETGGLSGKPLMEKSTAVLARMYQLTGGKIPLIGVGGIASAEDAYAKIRAGASAVQLYSALVYQGFGLVERINRGLVALLARDGCATVAEAVGSGNRIGASC